MIFITRKFTCFCDNCNNMKVANQRDKYGDILIYGKNDFIKVLRKNGWTIGKIELCPICSKKGGRR